MKSCRCFILAVSFSDKNRVSPAIKSASVIFKGCVSGVSPTWNNFTKSS